MKVGSSPARTPRVMLAAALSFIACSLWAEAGETLVLTSADLPQLEAPARAFASAVAIPCGMYSLEHDREALALLAASDIDLVFALGADAARHAARAWAGVPIVFTMVLDWESEDLPRERCTGVALGVDPEALLTTYRLFAPQLSRLGVIHSRGFSPALLATAREAARALGLELVAESVRDRREVRGAFEQLKERVDALWMVADPAVITAESFLYLAEQCRAAKLPFFVFSENFVRAGGFLAVAPNYAYLGDQAAVLARRILLSGESPSSLAVEPPVGTSIIVNADVAKEIGLELSMDALALADLVIEGRSEPGDLESGVRDLVGRIGDVGFFALEELIVTSVSKRPQPVRDVPAAVYVLTAEDIHRSGARDLDDVLRQVPGLDVADVNGWRRQISARGFSEGFSPAMLVLVDGRAVYTPLFGGMNWDHIGLPLEDIDRIEVIRGPGGTIYGSNAVNGVINIITKSAADTQGALVSQAVGNLDTTESIVRYGTGSRDLNFRVWGRYASAEGYGELDGERVPDAQRSRRAGGRLDWELADETVLTGVGGFDEADFEAHDMIRVALGDPEAEADGTFRNYHALVRIERSFAEDSRGSLQVYYDHVNRLHFPVGYVRERYDTLDLELQHTFAASERNTLTWGLNARQYSFRLESDEATLSLADPDDQVNILSGFVQDEIALGDAWIVTLGTKVENHSYVGTEWQPGVKAVWQPSEEHSLWSSISRAIRTPSLVEDQVTVLLGPSADPDLPGVNVALGNDDLEAEKLIAYETGYRWWPAAGWSTEVDLFYNAYSDLIRAVAEPGPPGTNYFVYQNGERGRAWGGEVILEGTLAEGIRSQVTYSFQNVAAQAADNSNVDVAAPRHKVTFRQYVDLPWDLEFSTWLRWTDDFEIGSLDTVTVVRIDDYTRVDAQIEKRFEKTRFGDISVALVGQNLLDPYHPEFLNEIVAPLVEVRRSYYVALMWRF
ncbi:MAG: TonB-dependent receptor [Planctomycetota bacterium]